MKSYLIGFICFQLIILLGCSPKKGHHPVVPLSAQESFDESSYISYLKQQMEDFPEAQGSYLKLAAIYQRKNDWYAAKKILLKARRINPNDAEVMISLGYVYLHNKDDAHLYDLLNELRKQAPEKEGFLKLSAYYALLKKDYSNASFFSNSAFLANPYDDENSTLIGKALLMNKDSLGALAKYYDAFNLNKNYLNFARLFKLAINTRRVEEARKYMDEFMNEVPSVDICYERGMYLTALDLLDSAKQVLSNCINTSDPYPGINFELAKIYLRQNQLDSSLYYIKKYNSLRPDKIEGYVFAAKVYDKQKQYAKAKDNFLFALKIDSTSIIAKKGLNNLDRKIAYLQLKRRKEAVQRQINQLKPLNAKEVN